MELEKNPLQAVSRTCIHFLSHCSNKTAIATLILITPFSFSSFSHGHIFSPLVPPPLLSGSAALSHRRQVDGSVNANRRRGLLRSGVRIRQCDVAFFIVLQIMPSWRLHQDPAGPSRRRSVLAGENGDPIQLGFLRSHCVCGSRCWRFGLLRSILGIVGEFRDLLIRSQLIAIASRWWRIESKRSEHFHGP